MSYFGYNGYGQEPPGPVMPPRSPVPSAQQALSAAQAVGAGLPMVNAILNGFAGMADAINQNLSALLGMSLNRNEEWAFLTLQDSGFVTVSAGATNVRSVMRVSQDHDFVATAVMAVGETQATPPTIDQPFFWRIIDGSTNRELQRNRLPHSFLGLSVDGGPAGSRPLFLPKPRIFSRNSDVIWLFDSDSAVDIDVRVAFMGYRIYDVNALDLTRSL